MKRGEREAIMRQGVTLPQTPRERRQLEGLAADLEGSPLAGRPLPVRVRNFRPSADRYLASMGGPLAYMVRLRQIDGRVVELEAALSTARRELALDCGGDDDLFSRRWREIAAAWDVGDVNDLIEAHNRWYPVESRLPMDPASRDYALVNGVNYRRAPVNEGWMLERFPPCLDGGAAADSRPRRSGAPAEHGGARWRQA